MLLSAAALHALHVGHIGLGACRACFESLLKVRHARRHSVGENRPGTDGKDAESRERNDNCCLVQVSIPSRVVFG
jgi:hypothetical protein